MEFDEVIKEALKQHRDRKKPRDRFSFHWHTNRRSRQRQDAYAHRKKPICKIFSNQFKDFSFFPHSIEDTKKGEDSLNYDNCRFYAVMFYERFSSRYCAIKQKWDEIHNLTFHHHNFYEAQEVRIEPEENDSKILAKKIVKERFFCVICHLTSLFIFFNLWRKIFSHSYELLRIMIWT